MDTPLEIKTRMDELIKKWKDNKPVKFSNEYWRYRADQLLYISLRRQLASLSKSN